MTVAARLGAFAAVLALTFGGGLALGGAVGPDTPTPPPTHAQGHTEAPAPTTAAANSHLAHPPATQESQP